MKKKYFLILAAVIFSSSSYADDSLLLPSGLTASDISLSGVRALVRERVSFGVDIVDDGSPSRMSYVMPSGDDTEIKVVSEGSGSFVGLAKNRPVINAFDFADSMTVSGGIGLTSLQDVYGNAGVSLTKDDGEATYFGGIDITWGSRVLGGERFALAGMAGANYSISQRLAVNVSANVDLSGDVTSLDLSSNATYLMKKSTAVQLGLSAGLTDDAEDAAISIGVVYFIE